MTKNAQNEAHQTWGISRYRTFKNATRKRANAGLIVAGRGDLLLAACSSRRVPAIAAILDIPDI